MIPRGGHGGICRPVVCLTVIAVMADDIETIRKVGLQRAYALIRDLEAYRGFAPLSPEQRALWEERAEVRAQAFCDGLAADLALMTAILINPRREIGATRGAAREHRDGQCRHRT